MNSLTASKAIRDMSDGSRSVTSSISYCDLVEKKAGESDCSMKPARTAQVEAELLLRRKTGVGRSASLMAQFKENRRAISFGQAHVSENQAIVNDLLGQLPNFYVRVLLRGVLFATESYCTANRSAGPPLLCLFMKRLDK